MQMEYENLMRDIPIYYSKNMDLADWLLQIEKVAWLTHSQEYGLATAKSTSNLYKMFNRLGNDLDWLEIKRKLEEVYSPTATEEHATSNKHCKQWPDKTLQECIQNFTDLTEKALGTDTANITNRVVLFLFFKNLYNKDIQRRVAGAKIINSLADTSRLAHHSILKLKKYEGLVCNEDQAIA